MATEAQPDIDISPAPDSREFPASHGRGQQVIGQPTTAGGRPFLAFGALLLLLLGGLALLIGVLQPFADQVGGCGGG
jgi:uncharacterized membrane protein YphA (DoxX/SURF4 family)